jgi:hypothetical protein
LTVSFVNWAQLTIWGLARDFLDGAVGCLEMVILYPRLSVIRELVVVVLTVSFSSGTHHAAQPPPLNPVANQFRSGFQVNGL